MTLYNHYEVDATQVVAHTNTYKETIQSGACNTAKRSQILGGCVLEPKKEGGTNWISVFVHVQILLFISILSELGNLQLCLAMCK